jgi:hypothetical protein
MATWAEAAVPVCPGEGLIIVGWVMIIVKCNCLRAGKRFIAKWDSGNDAEFVV